MSNIKWRQNAFTGNLDVTEVRFYLPLGAYHEIEHVMLPDYFNPPGPDPLGWYAGILVQSFVNPGSVPGASVSTDITQPNFPALDTLQTDTVTWTTEDDPRVPEYHYEVVILKNGSEHDVVPQTQGNYSYNGALNETFSTTIRYRNTNGDGPESP